MRGPNAARIFTGMQEQAAIACAKLGLPWPATPDIVRAKYPGKRLVMTYHFRKPGVIGVYEAELVDENDRNAPPAGSVSFRTVIEESE